MLSTQLRDQPKNLAYDQEDKFNGLIKKQLLHSLGKPGDLLMVQVRLLWAHHYRVNIFIGKEVTSARIANSYFVEADSDGNIVESTPKIKKQY